MAKKLANWRGVCVEFNSETHTYLVNGKPWPNVTQILKPLENFSRVPAEILERARWFGTCVHKAIELHVKRDLNEATLDAPLQHVLEQFRKAISNRGLTIESSETIVAHPTLRYCGTADLVAVRKSGERELVDVKTGTSSPTVGLQTSAYAACFERKPKRSVLYLTETSGVWQQLNDLTDLNIFQSCLNLYRWRQNHNLEDN